jgi:hypothetical protein
VPSLELELACSSTTDLDLSSVELSMFSVDHLIRHPPAPHRSAIVSTLSRVREQEVLSPVARQPHRSAIDLMLIPLSFAWAALSESITFVQIIN